MEVVRLPLGDQAGLDDDCIRLEERPDGTWSLTGTALCSGQDEGESVSIVGGPTFVTKAEAEAVGLAWAGDVGVSRLVISCGTSEHPLETLEIDRPL